ncbi:hypothetical protein ETAA8_01050 [Anatilimnocola aggregata]|uniref:DUF1552 domain-containing protein n=1 Tax=Anatilimnocola aggregata TaxID=2528021 RepID=A0A517Y487_9BACT|nr:DUF1552 domain-containing protein [Anatilimnocola aggregata]QDU25044.1 hypothetical protein ETAA8_01050 [Anatilimnocola aggregata]
MNTQPALASRRSFLRGAGVALGLPWLESLGGIAHAAAAGKEPRRLLLICLPLGIYRDSLIPKQSGAGYELPEYLAPLADLRDRFTIVSGLEHPGVSGGHAAQPRIFTGVPSVERNRRSLDQHVATALGQHTRFDSLALSAGANDFGWTDGGSMVPAEKNVGDAFARLFAEDGAANKTKVLREIGRGKSILDHVLDEARELQSRLSKRDQEKLAEYFESVRATEKRLVKSEEWMHQPKPSVNSKPPAPFAPDEIITNLRGVCDLTHLAFKTDSTRVITFGYFRQDTVAVPGVNVGYHNLSHHGQDEGNIAQLKRVERAFFDELKTLLTNLKNTKEGDASLLDRTTILVTSNLGSGNSHSNKDLPVLLAGGRFKHGQHLSFAPGAVPLSNLYVSVLNQLGFDDQSFGTSTGALKGLTVA